MSDRHKERILECVSEEKTIIRLQHHALIQVMISIQIEGMTHEYDSSDSSSPRLYPMIQQTPPVRIDVELLSSVERVAWVWV